MVLLVGGVKYRQLKKSRLLMFEHAGDKIVYLLTGESFSHERSSVSSLFSCRHSCSLPRTAVPAAVTRSSDFKANYPPLQCPTMAGCLRWQALPKADAYSVSLPREPLIR